MFGRGTYSIFGARIVADVHPHNQDEAWLVFLGRLGQRRSCAGNNDFKAARMTKKLAESCSGDFDHCKCQCPSVTLFGVTFVSVLRNTIQIAFVGRIRKILFTVEERRMGMVALPKEVEK